MFPHNWRIRCKRVNICLCCYIKRHETPQRQRLQSERSNLGTWLFIIDTSCIISNVFIRQYVLKIRFTFYKMNKTHYKNVSLSHNSYIFSFVNKQTAECLVSLNKEIKSRYIQCYSYSLQTKNNLSTMYVIHYHYVNVICFSNRNV